MNFQHLSPEQLAAYVQGKLASTDRSAVENHLVVCDSCREELTEAARYVANSAYKRRRLMTMSVFGLAAAVACILLWPRTVPISVANELLRNDPSETVRTFPIIRPANGAEVPVSNVVFRWHAEESDPHYRIQVLDEVGDLVWSTELSDTTVQLPGDVRLMPGRVYFWYVDALLRSVRSSTTGMQEFTTTK